MAFFHSQIAARRKETEKDVTRKPEVMGQGRCIITALERLRQEDCHEFEIGVQGPVSGKQQCKRRRRSTGGRREGGREGGIERREGGEEEENQVDEPPESPRPGSSSS